MESPGLSGDTYQAQHGLFKYDHRKQSQCAKLMEERPDKQGKLFSSILGSCVTGTKSCSRKSQDTQMFGSRRG